MLQEERRSLSRRHITVIEESEFTAPQGKRRRDSEHGETGACGFSPSVTWRVAHSGISLKSDTEHEEMLAKHLWGWVPKRGWIRACSMMEPYLSFTTALKTALCVALYHFSVVTGPDPSALRDICLLPSINRAAVFILILLSTELLLLSVLPHSW